VRLSALGVRDDGRRPRVAILVCQSDAKTDYAVKRWLVDAPLRFGLYPAFMSWNNVIEQLEDIKPRAIILPGGGFPCRPEMRDAASSASDKLDFTRFDAYISVLKYAVKNRLPTLGICAGAQVMAGFLGGKIIGGINKDLPAFAINHNIPSKSRVHPISIAPDSLLYSIARARGASVNSRHNAAVSNKHIGDFRVVASAADGIIEALEPNNPWSKFVLGVQWHPEKSAYVHVGGIDVKIFDAFAKATE